MVTRKDKVEHGTRAKKALEKAIILESDKVEFHAGHYFKGVSPSDNITLCLPPDIKKTDVYKKFSKYEFLNKYEKR